MRNFLGLMRSSKKLALRADDGKIAVKKNWT